MMKHSLHPFMWNTTRFCLLPKAWWPVIWVVCGVVTLGTAGGPSTDEVRTSFSSNERAVFERLMSSYDKFTRPTRNSSAPVTVYFSSAIVKIELFDEKTQILVLHTWLRQRWRDEQLVWRPEEHGGLESIRIPSDRIWTPDIVLYNSAHKGYEYSFRPLTVVAHDGWVLWIPHIRLMSTCPMNTRAFPYDSQTCLLKFGSWSYTSKEIDLQPFMDATILDSVDFEEHHEWEVVNVSVARHETLYPCCPEPYTDISYSLHLQRNSDYYQFMFLSPAVLMVLLIPGVFMLSGELATAKIVLGVGVMLGQIMLLAMLVAHIPGVHEAVPLIGIYYLFGLALTSATLTLSLFIICIYNLSSTKKPVPKFLKVVMLQCCGAMLCVKREDVMPEHSTTNGGTWEEMASINDRDTYTQAPEEQSRFMRSYNRALHASEWRQLAAVLDRIFFLFFTIVGGIVTLALLRW